MPIKYHFIEFCALKSSIIKNIKCPILHIYAYPYPYGEQTFNFVNKLLTDIEENSKSSVDLVKFEGTHHFHMINPTGTAQIVLEFLKKEKNLILSNSKL